MSEYQNWAGLPSQLPPAAEVAGLVAVDTETSALHWDDRGGQAVSVVSIAWTSGGQNWKAAFPFAQGRYGKPEDNGVRDLWAGDDEQDDPNLPLREWSALLGWLQTLGQRLLFHNAKFDLAHLRAGVMLRPRIQQRNRQGGWAGVDLENQFAADTTILISEVLPGVPLGLKPLAGGIWTDEDPTAEAQALKGHLGPKTDPRYDLVPWEVIGPYAAKDAELTHRLVDWVGTKEGGDGGIRSRAGEIHRETEVTRALYRMEWAGIPYDAKLSREIGAEVERRVVQAELQLPFQVSRAKDYYYGEKGTKVADGRGGWVGALGLEPYELTEKTGQPKFTADTLDRLAKHGKPWARELAEVKKAKTAAGLWYFGYGDRTGLDGRLRTMFRQVTRGRGDSSGGTASGRFSVERVNLQAIPHDYRLRADREGSLLAGLPTPRGLVASAAAKLEGWKLYELDLAQAEMRAAALDAGCESMIRAFRNGDDLHGLTAQELFGVKPGDENWGEMRQVAKRGNFSLIFGSGPRTFRDMVRRETGIDLGAAEAGRVVAEWNGLYPEYKRAIDRWGRVADARGAIPLVGGRKRRFAGHEDTHKAFNQRIQGSLAELGKEWLLSTDRELRGLGREGELDGVGRAGLLLVIHDSQVLLLPERDGEQIAAGVAAAGVKIWDEMFPGVPGGVDVGGWKG